MRKLRLFKAGTVCLLALTGAILAPSTKADDWSRTTIIPFASPLETPGVHLAGYSVLPAGNGVGRILHAQSVRHIVQILSQDEKAVDDTIVAVPDFRLLDAAQLFPRTANRLPITALPGLVAFFCAFTLFMFAKRFQWQPARSKVCGFLLCAASCLGFSPFTLQAQSVRAPVNLGTAGNYVVLSQTGITDVPASAIVGNIGASPITGAAVHLTCAEVTGTISVVDAAGPAPCSLIVPAVLGQAVLDMGTAYTAAAGVVTPAPDAVNLGAGDISGLTIPPGLYKWSTGVAVNTSVTLSGGPNAVWIFQIAGDLLLANNAQIVLAGGARANNVFWQVAGPTAVTLGTGAVFSGTILSAKQVIMNTGATLNGRALAQTQVTLQSTGITTPGPLVNGIPIPVAPTVTSTVPPNGAINVATNSALSATFSEAMNPATISTSTFTLMNGLTPITGVVSYVGVTATFTPSVSLPGNTLLTATVTTGAQDPAGVGLANNYVWTFTTAAAPDLTPPTVSSTVPANGATSVPIGNALSATFSEAMNPLTINTATFLLKQGGAAVAGTVTYSGVTATFTPIGMLAASLPFTATITTGVQDLAGNAMAANYVWTFTTGAAPDLTPPTVSSTVPANGATSVPIGNALSATFSEAMNPLTINTATFLLKQGATPVAGTVTYSGVTATFTPIGMLAASLPFTATITTGVQDLAGNAMAANYVWTFTTGAAPDLTPPTVSSTVPANGATSVPIGNALSATFSEAMNPLTINTATFLLKQGGAAVAGTVTYSGVTATFTPIGMLAASLPFTATITTGVQDLAGNAMAANYVWTFTTGAAPDLTPPTVSSTVPANGATSVPIGNALSATFSEAMNPLTINTATFLLKQGGAAVAGTVTYSGVTATFTPIGMLAASLPFTATITTGVQDLAGNAMAANYVWTFTTGAAPDLTPPTVSSTAPANGATSVPIGNALSATFSEAMNPLTINTATFLLKQGGAAVAGTVTYSGVTATFTPIGMLAASLPFTATITTGVQDLAGNAMAANYVWTFTTGAAPDLTPPTVSSTVPANGATSVPIGNALSATFSEAMNPLTINTATFLLKQGGAAVAGTVTYSGVTATFTPIGMLAASLPFTATITTGVQDLAGNAMAANYVWTFTTGAAPDLTPPTVISTLPANGATQVPTTADLVANFSEVMNPLTISAATFMAQLGTTQIQGTVTYSGTSARFRPAASLSPNSAYTAVITTGAADPAGNVLQANYVWTFTTGASGGQTPICLANFAVLGATGVVSTGSSIVNGDVGVGLGSSISGFPPGTLNGAQHVGDAAAALGIAGFTAAYADAVSRAGGVVSVTGDIGGQTFTPGIYRSASSLQISSGNLTLDAKGNPNAVFIFQMASALTTAAGNQILLAGGAQAFNVFWQVGSSATLGAASLFNGSILADQSITINANAAVNGRLEALTGTITLQSSTITSPSPAIAVGGIVNAADEAQMVAAGSIASVFGNNLSSSLTVANILPLPVSLGGSSFQIAAQAAPLYMTSCSQANIQIPWESAGLTLPPVTGTTGDLVSTSQPLTLAPFAPGIFSLNMVGSGQGAVQIAPTAQIAGPLATGSAPVARGAYVAIFCTGLGPVSNQPATGAAALASPLSVTSALPTVNIGGASAQVTFSGLAPGFAGLYQVNAIVPPGAPSGNSVSLAITIGGVTSNTVTIAIQ